MNNQMIILEYLYNFPLKEVEVRDIVRNTALKPYTIHNAIKSLIARKVITKTKITSLPTQRSLPPVNKIKVKIKPGSGYNKVKWLLERS